jgi:hypothetical protein
MVERARFRDRLYFCSDATAACDLGLSRRTIIRARLRLEEGGKIIREKRKLGRAVVYSFPLYTRRKPREDQRVTQRSSAGRQRKPSNPRYARVGASKATMTEPQLPQPTPEPVTASTILSAAIDTLAVYEIPVTSRAKGMLARQAKELLQDGFPAEVILTASVLSIQRGAPGHMHYIAQDIVVARAGKRITRSRYERELNAAHKLLDPGEVEHRERLHRALGGQGP